jgi:phage protein U
LAIGNWGTDIIFRVSDKTVLTFQNLTRTVGAEWATHSRVGKKDQTEFLRPKLQKVTFSIYLDATYGVKPRSTLDRLANYCETGTVNPLVVGGKRVGQNRWKITDLGETWDTVMNRGELVRATVSVTMEEYL